MSRVSTNEILAKVETILGEALEEKHLALKPETLLEDIPNLDSFGVITLFMSIEGTFGVRFSMDDITGMKTIGDVLTAISSRLTNKNQ